MRSLLLIAPVLAASLLSACVVRRPALVTNIPAVSGKPRTLYALEYIDVAEGKGAAAESRKCAYVHYTGWLQNGTKFDSSRDTMPNGTPRDPIAFPIGARRVILGWDSGFDGMRVGGRRRLFIPYQLAYGETGRGEIPPKAPLIFDIELMAIADTMSRATPAQGPPQCAEWSQVRR
jgi:peptidylprolyl isomerase